MVESPRVGEAYELGQQSIMSCPCFYMHIQVWSSRSCSPHRDMVCCTAVMALCHNCSGTVGMVVVHQFSCMVWARVWMSWSPSQCLCLQEEVVVSLYGEGPLKTSHSSRHGYVVLTSCGWFGSILDMIGSVRIKFLVMRPTPVVGTSYDRLSC